MDLKQTPSEGSLGSFQPTNIQVFAGNSTFHGIRHIFIYGPMTIRRLLWMVAFIVSLGLLVVESSERVAYFFSYPHVTKVDEVVANSLVFPAVTICNLNQYRFSKLSRNDLYHAGELLALLNVHMDIPDPHLAEPEVLTILKEKAYFENYKPKPFSMLEFMERVGHDMKEMMLSCKFKGQVCTYQDFKVVTNARPRESQLPSCLVAGRGAGYSGSGDGASSLFGPGAWEVCPPSGSFGPVAVVGFLGAATPPPYSLHPACSLHAKGGLRMGPRSTGQAPPLTRCTSRKQQSVSNPAALAQGSAFTVEQPLHV
ncbi:ASIC2 protein, partial [Polyodon spathula]|nr:ASIC2 protein [Polyodon spathula]